jgi:hypothetical protein
MLSSLVTFTFFACYYQGRSSSQIFGGAKKIAKKESIFFPFEQKNNFELDKNKIFGGADAQINT